MLYNFYGNEVANEYHGRITRSEKLLRCPCDALELELGVIKVTSTHRRVKFERNFLKNSIHLEANCY